jgi:putative PIN family toxin of toxin-antitoxin system
VTICAVVDTNVLVSGIFWKGAPFEILQAWEQRRFELVISPPILTEYRRVLEEMTKKRSAPVNSIVELIELHSQMVTPVLFVRSVCTDPDDDKFLEAGVAASADYVVSGDVALLKVKEHHGVKVVKPAVFLSLLG